MILIALTFSIVDGDGLYDPGVAAYPIFIILGTVLIGKCSMFGLTLASVISLLFIAFFQSRGLIDYRGRRTIAGLLLMPASRHLLVRLNEALQLKRRLN